MNDAMYVELPPATRAPAASAAAAPVAASAPKAEAVPEDPRGFTLEHNRDGSIIIKLRAPSVLNGERVDRLTIPALTGRHMRKAGWSLETGANAGDLIAFAAEVVEPLGIVDALPAWVARSISVEVFVALGKSRPAGAGSSPE